MKAVVFTVINFWVSVTAGVPSPAEELFASQERLFSNESCTSECQTVLCVYVCPVMFRSTRHSTVLYEDVSFAGPPYLTCDL